MCFSLIAHVHWKFEINFDLPVINNDDDKNIHDGDDVRYHVIE